MKIRKKSLIFLLLIIIICPLLGNQTPLGLSDIEKYEKILLFTLPIPYFIFFCIDCKKNKYNIKFDLYTLILIACCMSLFISIIFSINKNFNVITNCVSYLYIFGFLYTIHVYEFSKEDIKKIIYAIITSFTIIALIGIMQYIFKIDVITRGIQKYPGSIGRISSTMSNATILDKYLAFNLILFLYIILKDTKYTKFIIPLLLIGTIAIAFTYSRTGIFIYYLVLILFILIYLIKKQFVNAIISIILIILLYNLPGQNYLLSSTISYANTSANEIMEKLHIDFLSPINNTVAKLLIIEPKKDNQNNTTKNNTQEQKEQTLESIEEYYTNYDHSNISRSYYKDVAKAIIKEYPIMGIGIGNYNYIYKNQNINDYLKNKIDINNKYLYPHDQYLHYGAETGLLGLSLLLVSIISVTILSIKNNRLLIALLFLISFMIFSMTESVLYMKDIAYWFIIIYSLLIKKGYESKL